MLCFLFLNCFGIYFLIPAVIPQSFDSAPELVIPIGIPTYESKA